MLSSESRMIMTGNVASTLALVPMVEGAKALVLTLNRPAKLNAISPELLEEISAVVDLVPTMQGVRVLIIRGAGERAFCSGADLGYLRSADGAAKKAYIEGAYTVFERLARLPIATIAVLHGYVLGGGLELALACDLRIAQADAVFGLPELALNSVPSFGAVQRLGRLIGQSNATRLLLLSERISGQEAFAMGLVHRIGTAEVLDAMSMEMAMTLSARNPEAVCYLKTVLRSNGLEADLAAVTHALISCDLQASSAYHQATQQFGSA